SRGGATMNTAKQVLTGAVVALAAAFSLASGAQAAGSVSINAARVGAKDVATVAKFYESAFGLKEVRRFEGPNLLEILMNFGDTADAAKANTGAQIVVMNRASDDPKDAVPHLIFNVTDINATVAAVNAGGGKVDSAPREFGKTGIMIGIVVDPAGNKIEL